MRIATVTAQFPSNRNWSILVHCDHHLGLGTPVRMAEISIRTSYCRLMAECLAGDQSIRLHASQLLGESVMPLEANAVARFRSRRRAALTPGSPPKYFENGLG